MNISQNLCCNRDGKRKLISRQQQQITIHEGGKPMESHGLSAYTYTITNQKDYLRKENVMDFMSWHTIMDQTLRNLTIELPKNQKVNIYSNL